jgi:hypothetical protein
VSDDRLSTPGPRADRPPRREQDQPALALPRPPRLRRRLAGAGALLLVGGVILLSGVLFALAALLGGVQPVDLARFLEEQDRDPPAAQWKYKGKTLELTGYVVEPPSEGPESSRVRVAPVPGGTSQAVVWVSDPRLLEEVRGYPAGAKVRLQVRADHGDASSLTLRAVAVLPP